MLVGLTATAVVAASAYVMMPGAAAPGVTDMTPSEVLAAVRAGDVLLVDIRRPDEWENTGIAEGAVPIDMRSSEFIDDVLAARASDTQPVALICARGVRSQRMTTRLFEAGITPIIDVPEGMLGSFAGPGWLRSDLPVVAWSG